MRGEFIGIWSETWTEIWEVVAAHENAPDDVFCELYRELAAALKEPSADDAIALAINDAIQTEEIFKRALALADIEIDLTRRKEIFQGSGALSLEGAVQRRAALETSLITLIGDPAKGKTALSKALSELVDNADKRAEALKRARENIINDTVRSKEAFRQIQGGDLAGELSIVTFLERAYGILEDLGNDSLANHYFNLLDGFIAKFSLRYDLRRPCIVCPTLPGIFASLVRDLRALTSQDLHLDALMKDFEDAIRDLRIDCSDRRIKTCIQKQVNLLEAVGRIHPRITRKTLGAICNQIRSWPHEEVKQAIQSLYGFTCDYPGIRHSGTPANAHRAIDMRDLVAMSILLAGFTPYLTEQINAEVVYRGR